jgi:hypothetical protein
MAMDNDKFRVSRRAIPANKDGGVGSRTIVSRRRRDVRNQGLFPSEDEIARRLSQEPCKWRATAIVLERHGLRRTRQEGSTQSRRH